MKKVIFLIGVTVFYIISCTSSKENISKTSKKEYYSNNSYAKAYINDPSLISRDSAFACINEFRKHTYKSWRKKKLLNAWSTFDNKILDSIVKDPETDSIFFFLAAHLKSDPDSERKHPFVIMMATPKPSSSPLGGSAGSGATVSTPLYFAPVSICPPPNTGCRIPGGS